MPMSSRVLNRMLKQRNDSESQFRAAGRTDLADRKRSRSDLIASSCRKRSANRRSRRHPRCNSPRPAHIDARHGQGDERVA
jgi:hypothetical protein